MPHEHIELAQTPNGEIGPRCNSCGTRLTFGEAMVVDKHYFCWAHILRSQVPTPPPLKSRERVDSGKSEDSKVSTVHRVMRWY